MVSDALGEINNLRRVGAQLATSGQPNEQHLAAIAREGYEVVINLALHNDPRYSLQDEAATVSSLGMEYIHIPVKFDRPTQHDLHLFFDSMQRHRNRKIWVHCAANMRVTAFLGLYWEMHQGLGHDEAFALMHSVWTPNNVWSAFISKNLHASAPSKVAAPNGE
jgi:protein tyrosine phosphatase (PTP) superfamily phosphohydrolase (DUF442 family)